MEEIKDSGSRREFSTGAVRDMAEGKGRFDLMPLMVVSALFAREDKHFAEIIECVNSALELFRMGGNLQSCLFAVSAIDKYCREFCGGSKETAMLEVAKHFERGAKKYGEYNWQKGLPPSCYIDSAMRHLIKFRRGDDDEPHGIAFVWNMMCFAWEVEYSDRADSYHEVAKDEH